MSTALGNTVETNTPVFPTPCQLEGGSFTEIWSLPELLSRFSFLVNSEKLHIKSEMATLESTDNLNPISTEYFEQLLSDLATHGDVRMSNAKLVTFSQDSNLPLIKSALPLLFDRGTENWTGFLPGDTEDDETEILDFSVIYADALGSNKWPIAAFRKLSDTSPLAYEVGHLNSLSEDSITLVNKIAQATLFAAEKHGSNGNGNNGHSSLNHTTELQAHPAMEYRSENQELDNSSIIENVKAKAIDRIQELIDSKQLSLEDQKYLSNTKDEIESGEFDQILLNATADFALCTVLNQLTALGPGLIAGGISIVNDGISSHILQEAGKFLLATYPLAPVPSIAYLIARRGKPENLKALITMSGISAFSFIPVYGNLHFFFTSLALQSKELAKFAYLSGKEAARENRTVQTLKDFFLKLLGRQMATQINDKEPHLNEGFADLPESLRLSKAAQLEKGQCSGGAADTITLQQDCRRIVANNYLKEGLSNPDDEEIVTIDGTHYLMDNIDRDTKGEAYDATYVSVTNGDRTPLMSARLVKLQNASSHKTKLPMMQILENAKEKGEIEIADEEEKSLGEVEYEITRLGFNFDKAKEAQVNPALVIATWIRTIYLIMEHRNIKRMGAVVSEMAYNMFKSLGIDLIELGTSIKYKSSDNFDSRFIIIDKDRILDTLGLSEEVKHKELLNFIKDGNTDSRRYSGYREIKQS